MPKTVIIFAIAGAACGGLGLALLLGGWIGIAWPALSSGGTLLMIGGLIGIFGVRRN